MTVPAPSATAQRGRFVTFEGIDGAGKSTHVEALAAWLRARGHPVVVTREPGGTALAEALRALLLQRPMDALTEALLVFAARRDHLEQCIGPALAAGQTVLCDRFADASFAYQGAGRGLAIERLTALEHWVLDGRSPDLTLWFDVPAGVARERRTAARSPDRFEQQDEAFFQRVHEGYAARAAADPGRIVRVDGQGTPELVWQRALQAVQARPWW